MELNKILCCTKPLTESQLQDNGGRGLEPECVGKQKTPGGSEEARPQKTGGEMCPGCRSTTFQAKAPEWHSLLCDMCSVCVKHSKVLT